MLHTLSAAQTQRAQQQQQQSRPRLLLQGPGAVHPAGTRVRTRVHCGIRYESVDPAAKLAHSFLEEGGQLRPALRLDSHLSPGSAAGTRQATCTRAFRSSSLPTWQTMPRT
jgi:hypothetical protein